MCFSFAVKMVADTNQLKELRRFLRVGNEDSAKRLIQTLILHQLLKGVEESKSKIKNGILKK